MAKVDLSSQAWCDLVFSGKNKAYGAYKMRETSPRRHNIAVILVIVIALIGFSIPTLIKMATPKQKEVMTEVTTLSQLGRTGSEAGRDEADRARGPTAACIEKLH